MGDVVQAIVLGITQGLSEFLPVSSSGHLILVSWLFGWEDQGLAFDVGLHAGTLAVLVVYFWKDWYLMASSALGDVTRRDGARGLSPPSETLMLIAIGPPSFLKASAASWGVFATKPCGTATPERRKISFPWYS